MAKHELTLPFKKETKNALQYQAEDRTDGCLVPTLYVMKRAFPDCPEKQNFPAFLKVTVEGSDTP